MQFNGKFLNPYDVLGLPQPSDIELVKATYKSLVKIYHPDIFKGDKDFAKERLAQLNAAFEFLSNKKQKNEFDKKSQSQGKTEEQTEFDPDKNSNEFDEGIKLLKTNWDFACDYYPELQTLYNDLKFLGKEPSFAFMAYVVETKNYHDAANIASSLEDAFLTAKFSEDNNVKTIAKIALKKNQLVFAKELNRALKILGTSSSDKILMKLSENFPDFTYEVYTSIGCYELISDNHPRKIMDHKEKFRQENSDPYMSYLKENKESFSSGNELDPNNQQTMSGFTSLVLILFILIISLFVFLF
jgi:curved DNA-binding protein CbpA